MLSEERKKELKNIIENKFNISLNDCCFVGSMPMEYFNMRKINDIDIITNRYTLDSIISKFNYHLFKDNDAEVYQFLGDIEFKFDFYKNYINICDNDIIYNSKYYIEDDGIKIIRLELLYASKNIRKAQHDIKDIISINKYIRNNPNNWNWDLIPKEIRKKIMLDNDFYTFWQRLLFIHNRENYITINLLGIKITFKKRIINNPIDRIVWYIPFKILRNDIRLLLYKIDNSINSFNNFITNINTINNNIFNEINYIKDNISLSNDLIKVCDTYNFLNYQRFESGDFCAYDTIVRYKFIEEYLTNNKSTYWKDIYIKMQTKRIGTFNLDAFYNLINSFISIGYDFDSNISCNKNKLLDDGSHRLALSLYFNNRYLSLKLTDREYLIRYYGIEWFKEVGFNEEEINNIEIAKDKLFYEKGIYFPAVIWSPIQDYFNDVEDYISKIEECKIISSLDINFNDLAEFKQFTSDVYKSDDIADWKVDYKFKMFVNYRPVVRIIYIEIPFPKYRKKDMNNHDISTEVERIKKLVRDEFKDKIEGYFPDVIIHIGDNFEHNRVINKVVDQTRPDQTRPNYYICNDYIHFYNNSKHKKIQPMLQYKIAA